ncbi:hypothetical protein DB895_02535 [Flavobacterium psychrotolerans]|uniref:Uncharacterized protein n=1 Tax=Flavobacterium psychrotolerans TaxID=2169410 RepID=A0A2U1JPJ8_9FLAO|nr:hypothetical protein DB895_02535 [Flavobacterium psychrotolerans]
MNERWKYQIKTGSSYGITLTACMTMLQWRGGSVADELLSMKFFLRVFIFFTTGIFILGYIKWKGKVKVNNKQ